MRPKLRDLEIGFYRYAVPLADELAEGIDPPLVGTLVDIGGGCGAYSMALCRRHPQLQAQIFDIPETIPIANKILSEQGMTDRVVAVARDYATSGYGDGLAAVLLSNMFHAETDEKRRLLLEHSYAALAPGGRVILNGNFLGDDRVNPPFAALHHLSSMILWQGGGDYTIGETTALLREVGFGEPKTFMIGGNVSTVLVAVKPGAS